MLQNRLREQGLYFFGSLPFLTTVKIALVSAYVKCSRPNKFGKFAEDVETQSEDVRKFELLYLYLLPTLRHLFGLILTYH